MFKKILFPTQFEEFSMEILESVSCLQAGGLEEVVLLHVIHPESLYTDLDWGVVFNAELIEREARRRFDAYTAHLASQGIASKIRIGAGRVPSEIIKAATDEKVSLIVAGRQKRGILGELFVGSTTPGIVRKSDVPVLVAKYHTVREIAGEIRETFCTDMFRKILYPTDWSECAEHAKRYLPPLRQVGASEIVVVHVIEHPFSETEYTSNALLSELRNEGERKLKALEEELVELGFHVKVFLLEGGRTYRNITELASQEDVSMIVMGSHGRGAVAEALWGSVCQRVAEYSEKPVLIVK